MLLALATGPGERAHGYAIMGFVAEVTGGAVQPGPGTLYRTLTRPAADELPGDDSRRRYYRITPAGRAGPRLRGKRRGWPGDL